MSYEQLPTVINYHVNNETVFKFEFFAFPHFMLQSVSRDGVPQCTNTEDVNQPAHLRCL